MSISLCHFHHPNIATASGLCRVHSPVYDFRGSGSGGWWRPDHPGQVGTGLPWTSGAGPTIPEGNCFQFFPHGQLGGAVAGVTRCPWVAKGPASSHASASPRFSASVSWQVAHSLTGVLSPSYTPASPGELRKHNKARPNMDQLNQMLGVAWELMPVKASLGIPAGSQG